MIFVRKHFLFSENLISRGEFSLDIVRFLVPPYLFFEFNSFHWSSAPNIMWLLAAETTREPSLLKYRHNSVGDSKKYQEVHVLVQNASRGKSKF